MHQAGHSHVPIPRAGCNRELGLSCHRSGWGSVWVEDSDCPWHERAGGPRCLSRSQNISKGRGLLPHPYPPPCALTGAPSGSGAESRLPSTASHLLAAGLFLLHTRMSRSRPQPSRPRLSAWSGQKGATLHQGPQLERACWGKVGCARG